MRRCVAACTRVARSNVACGHCPPRTPIVFTLGLLISHHSPTTDSGSYLITNCSQVLAVVRLAIRTAPWFRSADTYKLFATDWSVTDPLPTATIRYFSQPRMPRASAISFPPWFRSAVTYLLLAIASSDTVPSGLFTTRNSSQPPTAVRLAIKGLLP